MPALLLLGFEMDVTRVMTVSVLGGVLGILMMIPLRRAFIVKQHGKLPYPEGTACAEVLVAGEKGGSSAKMVFIGFGIAAVHKFLTKACKLWADEPSQHLYTTAADGTKHGLKGGQIGGELAPELLGVGYLIGPRIASLMLSGAILSYFVIGPLIATFGENLTEPVSPAETKMVKDESTGEEKNMGLIGNMDPDGIKANYLRYIGAGAVAAGGIISMLRALPLILASIVSGLRDLRASRTAGAELTQRTERDLSMLVVLFGSLGLAAALMFVPSLGLGVRPWGMLGAMMILLFGFLFVTVSSRLTGEVGSSSNPISGMTIATLLLTCLIFLLLGQTDRPAMLTALSIAAVVCIASSNGGTTSQDLKTGYLVGATPSKQQLAIGVGAITSALVIGVTMLALNAAGVHYTTKGLPKIKVEIPADAPTQLVGRPYDEMDQNEYRVVHVIKDQYKGLEAGRYLVDSEGWVKYRTDIPIAQKSETMDNGEKAPTKFSAPQPQLFSLIIEGVLGGKLEWGLVITGVLIAITVELLRVSALPFAVGMYLPLGSSTPIFVGGMLRLLTDRLRGKPASEAETETSPGVLLSSGLIAGGTLIGLIIAFFTFLPKDFNEALDLSQHLGPLWNAADAPYPKVAAVVAFAALAVALTWLAVKKERAPKQP
jgi:uncharacterized oligopeptide transporter (OPT) family protein